MRLKHQSLYFTQLLFTPFSSPNHHQLYPPSPSHTSLCSTFTSQSLFRSFWQPPSVLRQSACPPSNCSLHRDLCRESEMYTPLSSSSRGSTPTRRRFPVATTVLAPRPRRPHLPGFLSQLPRPAPRVIPAAQSLGPPRVQPSLPARLPRRLCKFPAVRPRQPLPPRATRPARLSLPPQHGPRRQARRSMPLPRFPSTGQTCEFAACSAVLQATLY